MGKSRRNRALAGRSNPIVKPTKPPKDPELLALRDAKILPVIQDLRNADPKRRTAAASAVANVVQDTKCRKLLLREQVVPVVLTETLTDTAIESRAAGWEILRHLVTAEEDDFCVHLFRLDVLSAAEHASKMITEILTAHERGLKTLTKAHQEFIWQIACSLVCVLGTLAKAREEILEAITSNADLTSLVFVLATNEFSSVTMLNLTLSCLLILSTESLNLDPSRLIVLTQRLRGLVLEHGPHAVIACGILHEILNDLRLRDQKLGLDDLTDAFLVSELSQMLKQHLSDQQTTVNGDNTRLEDDVEMALDFLESIAVDQQDYQPGEDGTEEPEWEGIDDEEDMAGVEDDNTKPMEGDEDGDESDGDAQMDDDMGMDTAMHDDQTSSNQDFPTLRVLVQEAVPQVVRLLAMAGTEAGQVGLLKEALNTLGAIAWACTPLDRSDDGKVTFPGNWHFMALQIWNQIVSPILRTDTTDLEVASLVANLAWAVARNLQAETPLVGDEHRRFMTLYQATKAISQNADATAAMDPEDDASDSVGVSCIGVLGQVARSPAALEVNREIGVFLITVLESLPQAPAVDAIAALDEIFDIYGDEDFECDRGVFWKDGFLGHLEAVEPKVRAMAKAINKQQAPELRLKADEALLNLTRFLQYKRKHEPDD